MTAPTGWQLAVTEEPLLTTALVGPPPELPQALTAFMKGAKALARSMGLDGKPPPVIDVESLDGGISTERYEDWAGLAIATRLQAASVLPR
ncbi:unnamed protein product [Symbiodinium sp. CCMP2592]|nr:unnamed protein product [Symbiodinium sp. CCMP2592]